MFAFCAKTVSGVNPISFLVRFVLRELKNISEKLVRKHAMQLLEPKLHIRDKFVVPLLPQVLSVGCRGQSFLLNYHRIPKLCPVAE